MSGRANQLSPIVYRGSWGASIGVGNRHRLKIRVHAPTGAEFLSTLAAMQRIAGELRSGDALHRG